MRKVMLVFFRSLHPKINIDKCIALSMIDEITHEDVFSKVVLFSH
jgi:hypothetical protein